MVRTRLRQHDVAAIAIAAWALSGCIAPASVLAPTRVARAHTLGVGVGLEFLGVPSTTTSAVEIPRPKGVFWLPRPQGWLSYSLTDSFAVSISTTVPPSIFSAQVGLQWNPVRTRYLDLSGLVRGGLESCTEFGGLFDDTGFCQNGHGPGRPWYAHSSAVVLLGFNPSSWLTLQGQGGVWVQRGHEWRTGPWLGGNALFVLSDQVAIGPDVAVLPGWLDGRLLVQPSVAFVFWPQKHSNPYR